MTYAVKVASLDYVISNRGLLTECEESPALSVEILPPYGRQNDISVGMGFFTSLRSVQNDITS